MTERQDRAGDDALAELRAHTQRLAADLPGSLHRLSVRSKEAVIEVEWQRYAEPAQGVVPHFVHTNGHQIPAEVEEEQVESVVVSSPMVGTVYRAASPDKPPFVAVGDAVGPGQTVAIIEAMKLFNPIVSDVAGVVLEVLIEDGESVEFGQPLLRLKSSASADVNGHELVGEDVQ
jgi:acetyl-CoA carboxylase biotin carboxyl carrier protein